MANGFSTASPPRSTKAKLTGDGRTAGVFCTAGAVASGKDLARLSMIAEFLALRFTIIGGVDAEGFGTLGPQATTGPGAPGSTTRRAEEARAFGERFARADAAVPGWYGETMKRLASELAIRAGKKFRLADIDPDDTHGLDKKAAEAVFGNTCARIAGDADACCTPRRAGPCWSCCRASTPAARTAPSGTS